MHAQTRFIAFALFLACAQYVAAQAESPGGQKASFTMSISLVHGTVKPGSEVPVTVEATNTSAGPFDFIIARGGASLYTIQVFDSAGKAVPLTPFGAALQRGRYLHEEGKPPRVLVGSAGGHTIAPGETAKDMVDLDERFDLSKPGSYTVQLERLDPATKLTVKSNIVTLTVAN